MKRIARVILLGLMLAALPMRGYAGALMLFCGSHDGGAAVAAEHEHHGDQHDEGSHGATICSLCASCSAGAGLMSVAVQHVEFGTPRAGVIPFFASRAADFVPGHLDRPPSAL